MTLLVTGGAGFIGSNFIFYEIKNHPTDRIVCFDKLTYAGVAKTLEPLFTDTNFRFVKGDIANKNDVEKVFEEEKPDIIVNFAAESHVDRSIEDPAVFLKTNISGVGVLLDACKKYGVKRFHQVSTDEVYGDLPLDRPDLLFTESTPICASSPYSASKASADLLCFAYYKTFGLPVSVTRCSNNYGPYQFPEKLIPLVISRALNNEKISVYGNGENVRDWIYVTDHCKGVDSVIRNGKAGEVYNIGGNNEKKNIDVVKTILNILGKPESLIEFVTDRPGHDRRYAIDNTKIKTELSVTPETDFVTGIEKTTEWYINNTLWLNHILSKEYQIYNSKIK